MKKITAVILLAGFICGCVSVGHKLDEAKVEQIKKGATTRNQVIQLIGQPDQVTRDGDGKVTFQYVYVHASAKASSFIPLVGPLVGGVNTQNQSLSVSFDTNSVVTDILSTSGAGEVNTGIAK